MKKIILGALLGFILSIPLVTYADDVKNMVGKAIQGTFPVLLNGQNLETEAIVIDGTSYLPVRSLSEVLGLNVKFEDNTIILDSAVNQIQIMENTSTRTLDKVNEELEYHKLRLHTINRSIQFSPDSASMYRDLINEIQSEINTLEREKEELEKTP